MLRYPLENHLEQPAFCSPYITKQELQVRINHYKMVTYVYWYMWLHYHYASLSYWYCTCYMVTNW